MKNIILFVLGVILLFTLWSYFFSSKKDVDKVLPVQNSEQSSILSSSTSSPTDIKSVQKLPAQKILATDYYVSQTFNNCAPVALSMALYHYGIKVSQDVLAESLRPVHNLTGKNDDKETTPYELGEEARKYGLIPYFRPNGDIETLKKFIANGMPIITRTLLKSDEDYAHYRVVRGYDDETQELIQDDGYEGKKLRYSYDKFLDIWEVFNYGYLVLVPEEKKMIAEQIIGKDLDEKAAWNRAIAIAEQKLQANGNNARTQFNIAVASYYAGDYEKSVKVFEQVEPKLTKHTIWYQIEPIEAYYMLGKYDRVFTLTSKIINGGNPAYSELYMLRGQSYLKRGETALARSEFEKAVFYNKNYKPAQEAIASLDAN